MPEILFCHPCWQRGHRHKTRNLVDGIPTCVFCEDGEPCPADQEKAIRRCSEPGCSERLVANNPTSYCSAHNRKHGDKRPPFEGVPKQREVETSSATAVEESTTMEVTTPTKICGREGCGKALTERNNSGFCQQHFYDSKKKGDGQRGRKAASVTVRGKLRKADVQVETTVRQNGHSPAGGAKLTAGVATICVTEERLNHFLLSLPLERKAEIASEELGRSE